MALQLILLHLLLASTIQAAASTDLTLPGCSSYCGNVSIPYPFGISPDCYLNEDFFINCASVNGSQRAFLRQSSLDVLDITIPGQLRILSYVARNCYNSSGRRVRSNEPWMRLVKFAISNTRNKFITVGCDTYSFIEGSHGIKYKTGCMSLCDSVSTVIDGSCTGIGCCQTTIPANTSSYEISVDSFDNHTHVWSFNPCGFAFVAEEGTFNFSSADLHDLQNQTRAQTVLDWAIGNQTCDQVKENVCKDNSYCYDSINGPGYRCSCIPGYEGNPYLPNSCRGTITPTFSLST